LPLRSLLALAAVCLAATPAVAASLVVSANDGKWAMVNGAYKLADQPAPDTLVVIDAANFPPKIVSQVEVEHSVVAPPMAVALTPDEKLALVSAPAKPDPADKTKLVRDKFLQVVDLSANPPKVIDKVALPHQPVGIAIARSGKLALAAHLEGSVSVLAIDGNKVSVTETVPVGDANSRSSAVAITPDGKQALVTKRGEGSVALLSIAGGKVTYTKRDFTVGAEPYGIDVSSDGHWAAVANVGRGTGDNDSVSLIDLKQNPPRTALYQGVCATPEGIAFSPDGQLLAVSCIDGSNKAKDNPFHHDHGKLLVFALNNGALEKIGEAESGTNPQGVLFTPDGKHLLVQDYVEKEIAVYRVSGAGIDKTNARLEVPGFPAAIRSVP
jgi:DNA-binding beta-propeller fold protein YncE